MLFVSVDVTDIMLRPGHIELLYDVTAELIGLLTHLKFA